MKDPSGRFITDVGSGTECLTKTLLGLFSSTQKYKISTSDCGTDTVLITNYFQLVNLSVE